MVSYIPIIAWCGWFVESVDAERLRPLLAQTHQVGGRRNEAGSGEHRRIVDRRRGAQSAALPPVWNPRSGEHGEKGCRHPPGAPPRKNGETRSSPEAEGTKRPAPPQRGGATKADCPPSHRHGKPSPAGGAAQNAERQEATAGGAGRTNPKRRAESAHATTDNREPKAAKRKATRKHPERENRAEKSAAHRQGQSTTAEQHRAGRDTAEPREPYMNGKHHRERPPRQWPRDETAGESPHKPKAQRVGTYAGTVSRHNVCGCMQLPQGPVPPGGSRIIED